MLPFTIVCLVCLTLAFFRFSPTHAGEFALLAAPEAVDGEDARHPRGGRGGGLTMKNRLLAIALGMTLACLPILHAQGQTITAMAIPVDPAHLSCEAVHGRILGFDPVQKQLILTLTVPEAFDGDEVRSLQPGDAIYTQGKEVPILSVDADAPLSIVLNGGETEEAGIRLVQDADGSYLAMSVHDYRWTDIATLTLPLSAHFLFLDNIDPDTGEVRILPRVYDADGFLALIQAETDSEGVGFAANNVYLVFDAAGSLAQLQRYYVPWQ